MKDFMKYNIILFFTTLILIMMMMMLGDLFFGVGHTTNTKTLSEVYMDMDEYFWISLLFAAGIFYFKSKEK
jgi:hypothetical protein